MKKKMKINAFDKMANAGMYSAEKMGKAGMGAIKMKKKK